MYLGGKLEVFTQMSMRDAEAKRQEIFDEIEQTYAEATSEIKKTADRKFRERMQSETYKAQQVRNKAVVMASGASKRTFVERRTELIDKLFADVTQKLVQFMNTDEYKKYLLTEAEKLKKKYGEVELRLMPADMRYTDELTAVGVRTKQTDEDFIGGFVAYIPSKRALLNSSFKAKLENEQANFNLLS